MSAVKPSCRHLIDLQGPAELSWSRQGRETFVSPLGSASSNGAARYRLSALAREHRRDRCGVPVMAVDTGSPPLRCRVVSLGPHAPAKIRPATFAAASAPIVGVTWLYRLSVIAVEE